MSLSNWLKNNQFVDGTHFRGDGILLGINYYDKNTDDWENHKKWLDRKNYDNTEAPDTGHYLITKLVGFAYDESHVVISEASAVAHLTYLKALPLTSDEAIAMGVSGRKTIKMLNDIDESRGGTGTRFGTGAL